MPAGDVSPLFGSGERPFPFPLSSAFPFAFALVWLTPLSRLTLESVLYRLSRAVILFVRGRRPVPELLRDSEFLRRSHVVGLSPPRLGVDSMRPSSYSMSSVAEGER